MHSGGGGGAGAVPPSGDPEDIVMAEPGAPSFERATPSRISDPGMVHVELHVGSGGKSLVERKTGGSLEIIPENCPLDPNGRLSTSLDDQNVSSPSSCGSQSCYYHRPSDFRTQTLGRAPGVSGGRCGAADARGLSETTGPIAMSSGKRAPGRGQESKKSHICLPQVRLIYVIIKLPW